MRKTKLRSALALALLILAGAGFAAPKGSAGVNPVFFSGKAWPALSQMTRTSTDAKNDQKKDHLDIVADYFCWSDTKLYAAIQNRGGGFPTSGLLGTEYYSYMAVFANMGDQEYIWALTLINVPVAGFKPGLYRIEVKNQKNIKRIADISYETVGASNLLRMSCNISSLRADPLFKGWQNTDQPTFKMVSQSFKTTIIPFGTKVQDGTEPGVVLNLLKK